MPGAANPGDAGEAGVAELRALLGSIVGADGVALPGEAARVDGIPPRLVVRPGSVDEVRAIVRTCSERDLAIVPAGRGRHLDIGARPERCDVLLRLERLDQVLDHQPGDMTVTVGAGCTLAALAAVLGRHGQWLPVDPPAPESTTIGGLVSANLAGPLRASQGTVRDLLLGVELIDADGTLVHGGGRVVKNVAGYDLPKLYVGALGSLGVIVSATFKVRPRPAVEKAVVVPCATVEEGVQRALAIRDALEPLWLELTAPRGDIAAPAAQERGSGAAHGSRAGPESSGAGWLVVAGVAGLPAEVDDAVQRILHLAAVRGGAAHAIPDAAALRFALAADSLRPAAAVLKASILPTDVGAAVAATGDTARAAGVAVRIGAHLTSGVVRASVVEGARVPALVRLLRPAIAALGGNLVVERAAPDVKTELGGAAEVWGDPGPGLDLMRGVKAALDPRRILAPGRLPGGI